MARLNSDNLRTIFDWLSDGDPEFFTKGQVAVLDRVAEKLDSIGFRVPTYVSVDECKLNKLLDILAEYLVNTVGCVNCALLRNGCDWVSSDCREMLEKWLAGRMNQ